MKAFVRFTGLLILAGFSTFSSNRYACGPSCSKMFLELIFWNGSKTAAYHHHIRVAYGGHSVRRAVVGLVE